jgi:alpha-ketoglutarate-dependent taurine dioxygenase
VSCVAGEAIMFANNRVLHARSAYTIDDGTERVLYGCYYSFDSVKSKVRTLAYKLHEMSFEPFG